MEHRQNPQLEKGTFRIVCSECRQSVRLDMGDLTTAAQISMQYENQNCANCGGAYVLETNQITPPNRYDANNPYPDNRNQ